MIEVTIRELHARTGHYVRKASQRERVVVTHNGKPLAELAPLAAKPPGAYFSRRVFRPGFRKMAAEGKLRLKAGKSVDAMISEDRD